MKRKLALVLAVLMSVSAFNLMGCQQPDPPKAPEIHLSENTLTMDLFSEKTLTAELTGSEETIVWTTTDDKVASVNAGKIKAGKVGTATITATAGEISDSCSVTVKKGTMPVFTGLDAELSMIKGTTETLEPSLSFNNAAFVGAGISYATTGNVVSVTQEGVITALNYGEQDVVVKATYNGDEIATATVAVTVYELGVVNSGITNNEIDLTLTAELAGSVNEYTLDKLTVSVNGVPVGNPEFTITSADRTIADVSGNKIVAKGAGTTSVKVLYVSESKKEYDTTITVNVTKEGLTVDEEFFLKAEAGTDGKDVAVDLAAVNLSAADLEKVYIGNDEIEFTANQDVVTLKNIPCGKQTLALSMKTADYLYSGVIYDREIATAEQFIQFWSAELNTCEYTILSNDIDLKGAKAEAKEAFKKVFDGRGYTVSNAYCWTGLLTKGAQPDAVIKNVNFENYRTCDWGVLGGYYAGGTFENVKFDAYWDYEPIQTTSYASLLMVMPTGEDENAVTFRNCEFTVRCYAGAEDFAMPIFRNDNYYPVNMENVSVYYTGTMVKIGETVNKCDAKGIGAEITFGDKINANNLILLDRRDAKSVHEEDDGYRIPFETAGIGAEDTVAKVFVNGEEKNFAISGTDVLLKTPQTTGLMYVKVRLEDGAEKIFVVKPYEKETLSYDAAYTSIQAGKVNVDLTKLSKDIGSEFSKVKINGTAAESSVSGDTLLLTYDKGGVLNVSLFAAGGYYEFDVMAADYAIATKEEFIKYWQEDFNKYGYTVLTADLDLEGASIQPKITAKFKTVFDGLGHTVANAYSYVGLFNGSEAGAVFKNVTFTDFKYCNGGIFGGYWGGGRIEDVSIDAFWGVAPSTTVSYDSLLMVMPTGTGDNTVTFKNCEFTIRCADGAEDIALPIFRNDNYYPVNMENVTVDYTGTMVKNGETVRKCDGKGLGAEIAFGSKISMKNVVLTDKRDA
ncbi:MAG: hypothetical protein DBX59_02355 [Bacillota bacterium]|nr:MAG: hypothetical protein DBX59_02355 [Bacillota bacterium]